MVPYIDKVNVYTTVVQFVLDILFAPSRDRKIVHNMQEDTLAQLINVRTIPFSDPYIIALLPFHIRSVKALIHEAKYHNNRKALLLLGGVLREYAVELTMEESFGEVVAIPIPLAPKRKRERGYNQVEEIMRYGIGDTGMALMHNCLMRTRETASQTTLSKNERLRNMRDAFLVTEALDPRKTYLLCDDVCTTGATLRAGIDALKKAGAKNIIPLAIAYS